MKIFKRSCIGLAVLLTLGVFSGNALAEEVKTNQTNSENNIETTNKSLDYIEAREMLPGDVATEFEVEDTSGFLQTNALYNPRLIGPESDNPYYFEKNSYYLSGYGMPNCTAYAYGRAFEILGSKPNLCMGNANQWWDYNLNHNYYPYGDTPKVGSVICWNGSYAGHVAVVEKIEGNQVTYSESAWSGDFFTVRQYTIGNEDNASIGGFQGYIYLGDFEPGKEIEEEEEEIEEEILDTTPPSISNLEISNVDDGGFTVSCIVEDTDSGIDRVLFPIWTEAGGQDDIVWHQANVVGNIASKRIFYKDHNNERNHYIIHVYAFDKVELSAMTGTQITLPERMIKSSYRTHVQDFGWQDWQDDGSLAGTFGESKRLEGIEIQADDQGYDLGISYATHIQNVGWQDYRENGEMSGTEGLGLRLEAIRIQLTGADAKQFDVYYRVHAQNVGWLDWAANGSESGTEGLSYRLEAIQIRILPKGAAPPGETARAYIQSV